MTEETAFESLRVKRSVKTRVENEQDRRRRATGRKPTQTDVVNAALDALEAKEQRVAEAYPYASANRDQHDLLEFVLNNDPKAAAWISGNLLIFSEALRSRPPQRKRSGA